MFHRFFLSALLVPLLLSARPVEVSFLGGYDPDSPEGAVTRRILAFTEQRPELYPVKWGGLTLPGAGGRAPLLLAMAGGNAPDIYTCWFHIIRNDIENGFLLPLDPWLENWSGWDAVPELWRRVATQDGKVYGLPSSSIAYYGIIYRKDLVRNAGLDPEALPQTWDEFYRWCQKLTRPHMAVPGSQHKGQRAFGISVAPWNWLPWMQSAGASPVVQEKISPKTGKKHLFPMEETRFVVTESGEDLSAAPGTWRANFDSEGAGEAARFLQRLAWAPWKVDPETGEPVDLPPDTPPSGGVIYGVARQLPLNDTERFVLGEVVAMFAGTEVMERITANSNLDPDLIGIMPFPAFKPGMPRFLQAHKHFWGISEGVARRPKEEQDLVFACVEQLASPSLNDAAIREKVLEGNARWCNPADLKRLGLEAYLDEIPPTIRALYDDLATGAIEAKTEPFVGFWQGVSDLIQRRLIGIVLSEAGRDFDTAEALRRINADANRGLMFAVPEAELDRYRPIARALIGGVIALIAWLTALTVRKKKPAPPEAGGMESRSRFHAAWMLAPAILSIVLWSYYPLFQGVAMAFRNYRIVGESPWVGLDNFITVATDPGFQAAALRTFKYVGLTLFFGFTAPIILAVLLTEIPRGKVFFRMIYFLPHLTSTLVVTLLWQMMYDPTENGMLNRLLALFGFAPQAWLQDPALAMFCCVLPGVWAGAGISSLIYIAALQGLPPDYFEAAAIDGAGFRSRIRHILFPQLLPLMVINFVGAFIAAFQSIGSIFLLTFGGPGDATNVLSLAIWKEAYNNLRLGTATTMAWFLGVGLIGFTYLQFRILRKVEFRRADTN